MTSRSSELISSLVRGSGVPLVGEVNVFVDPMTGLAVARPAAQQPKPFRSREIIVALQTRDGRAKVFRIDWLKREVGVSVGLPYFSPWHALLGRYALCVAPGGTSSVSLQETGKVSQQPVKLSFHRSGEVLFSSDGKIRSEIRTNSQPLIGKAGHLFSVHVRGPGGFEPTEAKDEPPASDRRTVLTFNFDQQGDVGSKVVGWWYPLAMLRIALPAHGYSDSPKPVHLRTNEGTLLDGFLVAPPLGWPWDGYGLLLTATPFEDPEGLSQPYVLAIGGFGPHSEANAADAGFTFLGAMYSDRRSEIEEFTRLLGTVDLPAQ
jgi:hypothetical protein